MFVKKFKDISKENVNIAGGKGASLGEMYSSNIPVPNGFVVLSNAFDEFIKKTGLNNEIKSELDKVNIDNVETVENASKAIILAILQKEFPEEFKQSINKEFNELNTKFVAVRSSATSEDSDDAAWAGQLDTFLNTKKENLLENIKKCWASLFTPRAIFYRFEKELDKTDVSVAVVVQKMVESQISGIAFSVHPITENYNQILIEAGVGLGEAIVSGQITPDNYVIRKKDLKIETKNISEQNKALFRGKNGGVKWVDIKEQSQKLSDELIQKLSKIIINIEKHYGFPCDIEWAYENEELYITQSRPITTLSSTNKDLKKKDLTLYKEDNDININNKEDIAEFIKKQPFYTQTAKASFFACNIVFSEYSKIIKEKIGNFPLLFYVDSQNNFNQLLAESNILEIGEYTFKIYKNQGISKIKELMQEHKKLEREMENIFENKTNINNTFKEFIPTFNKWWELASLLEDKGQYATQIFSELILKRFDKVKTNEIIQKICQSNELSIFSSERIFILKTCSKIANNSQLSDETKEVIIQEAFETYKKEFFYFNSNFCDRKNIKLEDLRNKIFEEVKKNEKEYFEKEITTIKKDFEKLVLEKEDIKKELNKEENKLAEYISIIIEWVEIRKVGMMKSLYFLFDLLHELSDNKKISFEDLNLYTHEEIENLVTKDERTNITNRKGSKFSVHLGLKSQLFLDDDAKSLMSLVNHDIETITGQVASKGSGTIKGKIRIIKDPKNHQFEKGDILVTSMTRMEFVPLMNKAGAIITDEGGVACHAAIISRELKIPCIIGTKVATKILNEGDLVEVNVTNGEITVIEKAKPIQTYEKIVTRDLPILLVEGFIYSMNKIYKEITGNKPAIPSMIIYSKNGIIEEWMNENFEKELINLIYQENVKDTKFFKKYINQYKNHIIKYEGTKSFNNLNEFEKYINSLHTALEGFIVFYFTAMNLKTPQKLLQQATSIRNKDTLGDDSDRIIRNTLEKLCPETKNYETLIWTNDLHNIPKISEFKEREKGFLIAKDIFIGTKTIKEFEQEQPEYHFAQAAQTHKQKKLSIIKGQIGFKGIVKGKVRIIIRKKDIHTINEGEILVSTMTTPYFIPAMKKATAIITDEGGITCHAAIVSRELKIPCIIGTKNATEILHDGDYVEVDANKGIVKIIEKEKTAKPKSAIVDKFTEIIGNNKIINQNGEVYLLTIIFNWFGKGDQFIKFDNYPIIMSRENKVLKTYFDETKYEIIAKTTFINYLKNQKIKELIEFDIEEIASKINKLYEEYFITNKTKEEKLLEIFTKAHEYLIESTSKTIFSENFDKRIASECLKENELSAELDKVIKYSEKNIFESFENRFNRKIIENINNKAELTKMQFAFSDYTYIPSFEQLDKTISEINLENVKSNLLESEKRINANKLQIEVIIKDLSALDKAILQYFEWIAYMRDYRKEYLHKCQVLMFNTTRDLYKLWGVDINLATETLAEEICEGKEKLLSNLEKIKNRKNGFVILCETENRLIEEQENVSESIKKLDKLVYGENIEIKELRGETGAKGKYIGKVRVIKEKSEFNQFEEGEVLVAGMTRPEFVPLMKKSGAIVTDEGGLTCHAAIVSRELKIPCVIGTKYATRSFKTGDYVEVDANEGIVKILEKTNEKKLTEHIMLKNTPLYPFYFLNESLTKGVKIVLGDKVEKTIMEFENNNFKGYINIDKVNELGKKILDKIIQDETFYILVEKKVFEKAEKLMAFCKSIPKNLSLLTNKEISDLFEKYTLILNETRNWGMIPPLLEGSQAFLTDEIKGQFKKHLQSIGKEENLENYYAILSSSKDKSEIQTEELKRLEMISKINQDYLSIFEKDTEEILDELERNYPEILDVIRNHKKEFSWITYGFSGNVMKDSNIIELIKSSLKQKESIKEQISKINNQFQTIESQKEKLIEKLQIPNNLKYLFNVSSRFMFLKDWRKGIYQKSYVAMDPVIEEISKRMNISNLECRYLTRLEIKEALINNEDFSEKTKKRISYCVAIVKNGETKIYEGNEAKEIIKRETQKKEIVDKTIKQFKGSVAYPGKIKGIAKIINTIDDMSKMEEGNILVSATTNPDLILSMKKASGFITDFGGITSHAAIVSREMKKPCVVGTKYATSIIQDGDLIELDANKGIITILEKNEN